MDWQQKFAAIKAFAGDFETCLMMRKPGDWYVSAGMAQGGDGVLLGTYGNGATPEEAVDDHWRIYTDDMPHDKYAVADRANPPRRGRWNGFMWDMLTDEQAEQWRDSHRPAMPKATANA